MCLSCQICATKMVTTMNTPLRAPEKDNFQERKSRVLQVILEGCAFVRRRLKIFLRSVYNESMVDDNECEVWHNSDVEDQDSIDRLSQLIMSVNIGLQ